MPGDENSSVSKKKSEMFSNGVLSGMLFILVLHLLGANITQAIVRTGYEALAGRPSTFSMGRAPDFATRPEPVNVFESTGPDWRLVDRDGNVSAFQDFAGEVLFINLWASWCGPCISEMPHIAGLIDAMEGDVTFLLITNESANDFAAFDNPHDLPLVRGVGRWPAVLETSMLPTTLIVDRQGVIRHRHLGKADWSAASVRAYLSDLIAGTLR